MSTQHEHHLPREPEKIVGIDAEYLSGKRFPYQEDMSLIEDVDLMAATPGQGHQLARGRRSARGGGDAGGLRSILEQLHQDLFRIPSGREDEIARKVLIKHLQSGNSYGIALKEIHCKFPQPELGPWVEKSRTVGTNWKPTILEGWEPPEH